MNSISTLVATGFGIGYLPAPGTCGTLLLGLPAVFLLNSFISHYSGTTYQDLVVSIGLIVVLHGIVTGVIAYALPALQRSYVATDPQIIILDEVVGFLWVFMGMPLTLDSVVLGFSLFRLFDITKLWIIGWSECLPGAYGIVADDALAGIAARLMLQFILWAKNIYF